MIFLTTLYIVRHPEALGNKLRFFQGITDTPVTEKGEKQLLALAERFKDIEFDVIYTSPLLRAYKTAEAVNKYHNKEIIINKDLIEISGGELENNGWDFFETKFSNEYDKWKNAPHLFVAPNGDSMQDVYNRAKSALNSILKDNKDKRVVITSHGCAIRNMFCVLRGTKFEDINTVPWVDNTGVCKVEIEKEVKIVLHNDISHLTEELIPNNYHKNTTVYDWRK